MAGGPAHILSGAVAPIVPSKIPMKFLCSLPKLTSSLQSPRQNRLFAPKTQQAVWVRPLQTKIMCKPLQEPEMDGTNSGYSALGDPIKLAVKAAVDYAKRKLSSEEVGYLFGLLFTDLEQIKEVLEGMQHVENDAESELNKVDGSADIRYQVSFEIRYVIEDFDTSIETTQRTRLEVVRCVQRFFMSQQLMIRCVQRIFSLHLMIRCVQRIFSLHLMTRFWVTFKIFSIYLKIRDIKKREFPGKILKKIIERGRKPSSSIQSLQDRRRSFAEREEPEVVVGLKKEIETVTKQLINGEESRAVISIVGMGGSGKTTLAKRVYHDVKDAFECRAFICLSRQFEIKDVMMRMIEDVMGLSREEIGKSNEEELRSMLCDHLKKKKYLVVIDDIWSMEAWDMLRLILPDGKNKSRVMLTTRNKNVALYADPSSPPPVEMPFLVGDEAWELFMKKIFLTEKNPSTACPSELEDLGKKILAKCRGLPLVILAIGGLLARKEKTLNAWAKVLDSVDQRLTKGLVLDSEHVHPTEDPKWCMKILALSYWDLPFDLKLCFLYFGLFPEDYEIDAAKIIRLWIAEGFIQERKHKIIEDDAEEYLEKLIQSSMIQVSWTRHDGSVGGCRIHDFFRELAILVAQKNNFFTIHNVEGTHSLPNNIRRLVLHHSINGYHPTSTLRSILDFCGTVDISGSEFRLAKFLRVMSQEEYFMHPPRTAALIKELKEFVHLRYLELVLSSGSLPTSSLGDLDNLQTLVLKRFYGSLPDAVSNLKQLRHLDAPRSDLVGNLRVKDLTNLQTLSLAPGNWKNDGFGNLTNLRNLSILGPPGLYDETPFDSIEKLQSLRSLTLSGLFHLQLKPFTNHDHLYEMSLYGRMEKLPELPPNLTKLTLCFTRLEQDDISKLEKLPRLKILHLLPRSYMSEKMICSSRGFPQLEILEMSGLPLEEWKIEKGAMPSLKSVVLSSMLLLEEWIIEKGAMPSLKSVVLSSMPLLDRKTLPKRVRVLLKEF